VTPAPAEPVVERVADRIRIWSGQKQVLADRLADLRSGPVADIVDLREDQVPLARWNLEAPPAPPLPVVEDLWEPAPIDHWMPVTEDPAVPPCLEKEQGKATRSSPTAGSDRRLGPFDELFEVVSKPNQDTLQPDRPLPPLNRFRVRVAPVAKSPRPTKRNYDYFEELNAALAERARRSAADPAGRGGQSAPDQVGVRRAPQ
jgi:hypothetical protein